MKNQPKPKVAVKSTKVVVKPKTQEPTYKNLRMGVNLENREMTGENRNDIKPTKRDSMACKAGYNTGLGGSKGGLNESPVVRMGRYEGQNAKPKVAPKKKSPMVNKATFSESFTFKKPVTSKLKPDNIKVSKVAPKKIVKSQILIKSKK